MKKSNWMEKDQVGHFKNMQQQVIHWNGVAGRVVEDLESVKVMQSFLVKEELEELVGAYKTRDKGEFIKELCDALVVSLYEWHLHDKDLNLAISYFNCSRSLESCINSIEFCLEEQNTLGAIPLLFRAFEITNADMKSAWECVMANNYSKFIGSWEDDKLEKSLLLHPQAVVDTVDGYSVIKNIATGKVLKPYGYVKLTNMGVYAYE